MRKMDTNTTNINDKINKRINKDIEDSSISELNDQIFESLINKEEEEFREHIREIYLDRLQRKLSEAYNLDLNIVRSKLK